MTNLQVGDQAPEFTLPDANGQLVSLAQFRGKYVVLYFYPKDDTPGCTKEACDFRDFHQQFQDVNAVILGVSRDSTDSHMQFVSHYGLPFILLSDEQGKAVEAYGVGQANVLKQHLGLGLERTTFVINPEGKIHHIYAQVSVTGHVAKVLADLRGEK